MTEYAFWFTLAAIFALLILSAFFSGSETALTAASRARMHQLEKTGNRNASIVAHLIMARERLIGALLLGNNLVNILGVRPGDQRLDRAVRRDRRRLCDVDHDGRWC